MNFGWSFFWLSMLVVGYAVHCVISEVINSSRETVQSTCSSDKLTVKGYDVNITQVFSATCLEKVKFIEVFGMNKLFIDADFNSNGQQIQLSLIAPIWVIVGKRKIILDGKDGDEHISLYAPNAIGSFANGRPGKPGKSNKLKYFPHLCCLGMIKNVKLKLMKNVKTITRRRIECDKVGEFSHISPSTEPLN